MDTTVLIDSIVRQTTVLIAQLATAPGIRAPLAHTANQVFVHLVSELKRQGLGNKVIAEMFGLALRTYQVKVQRLAESSSAQGKSLWEALLEYIESKEAVVRADILERFRYDDEATVRAVLKDLVDSGALFKSGRGNTQTFRVASPKEYSLAATQDIESLANLAWVVISRFGPVDLDQLVEHVPARRDRLAEALSLLLDQGRITETDSAGSTQYATAHCVIPVGAQVGWEAAIFDHYQAVVSTICSKLESRQISSQNDDVIGGSTYVYDVWEGHPCEREVTKLLSDFRARAVELRGKVEAVNADKSGDAEPMRVIVYVGQTLLGHSEVEKGNESEG